MLSTWTEYVLQKASDERHLLFFFLIFYLRILYIWNTKKKLQVWAMQVCGECAGKFQFPDPTLKQSILYHLVLQFLSKPFEFVKELRLFWLSEIDSELRVWIDELQMIVNVHQSDFFYDFYVSDNRFGEKYKHIINSFYAEMTKDGRPNMKGFKGKKESIQNLLDFFKAWQTEIQERMKAIERNILYKLSKAPLWIFFGYSNVNQILRLKIFDFIKFNIANILGQLTPTEKAIVSPFRDRIRKELQKEVNKKIQEVSLALCTFLKCVDIEFFVWQGVVFAEDWGTDYYKNRFRINLEPNPKILQLERFLSGTLDAHIFFFLDCKIFIYMP